MRLKDIDIRQVGKSGLVGNDFARIDDAVENIEQAAREILATDDGRSSEHVV